MKTVAVTGASGYIGGRLVPALSDAGYRLVLVDDGSGPVTAVHPEHPIEKLDFGSEEGLRVLQGSDVVLHLAAVSGVVRCAEDPVRSLRVNVQDTERLVRQCREKGIPMAFASSFAVVGIPKKLPITESTPTHPTHAYAAQKATGEALVRSTMDTGDTPGAILRMSNVYGSYRVGPRTIAKGNVLNLFVEQARAGALRVFAPGTQKRDFIHLDDAVAHWVAVVRYLLDRSGAPGVQTFNVASGESASVRDVAEKFRTVWQELHPAGPGLKLTTVPNPRGSIELLQPEFSIDRRATEKALGVRCRWNLDEGIRSMLSADASTSSAQNLEGTLR